LAKESGGGGRGLGGGGEDIKELPEIDKENALLFYA